MKKLLIILLGFTLTLAGCGNLSAEDKVELIEKFEKMNEEDFKKLVEDAKYISVDVPDYALYLKSEGIKGDLITVEEMTGIFDEGKEKQAFYATAFNGVGYFEAVYQKTIDDGKILYYVSIGGGAAKMTVGKIDKEGREVATVIYELQKGELKVIDELTEENENFDEYKKLKKDYKEDAFTFFEEAFEELDSLIN